MASRVDDHGGFAAFREQSRHCRARYARTDYKVFDFRRHRLLDTYSNK
jgi:hypothetical protein